jgi:hypothetical protein
MTSAPGFTRRAAADPSRWNLPGQARAGYIASQVSTPSAPGNPELRSDAIALKLAKGDPVADGSGMNLITPPGRKAPGVGRRRGAIQGGHRDSAGIWNHDQGKPDGRT